MRNGATQLLQRSGSAAKELVEPQDEYAGAIAAAYEAGYAFHQRAVRESKMLLAWVLRPDYWNAEVPGEEL